MKFSELYAAVLKFLGKTELSKGADGRPYLEEEDKKSLNSAFPGVFVENFEKELAKLNVPSAGMTEEEAKETIKAWANHGTDELQKEVKELRNQLQEAKKAIDTMKREPVGAEGTPAASTPVNVGFKPDMSLAHNQMLDAAFKGAAYSGDSTIDTNQLKTEFGKYVNNDRLEIMKRLTGKTESTAYMTTIMTDKTEVRAMQASIDSVLQAFVPKWTPKAKSEFKPLTIRNYKCKINVPITPSDIMEDVLGYLYDENLRPEEMPIVKYILYQLIFPKLDEEREQVLACGVYKEPTATKDGDKASDAKDCMNGYVTQLINLKKAVNSDVTWLLDGEELTDENIVDQIDKAVGQVKPLYKRKQMTIMADPEVVTRYAKAYRKRYPWLKNEDGEKIKVDFSNFTFAPLEGMRGTGAFFLTPKENFKHLISKNPQQTRVYMQTENYDVKIFAEWWEGTGFWLAEALFAYLPSALTSGSSLMNDEGV